MPELVVVLDNLRSAHNVGSILRSCDGFGIKTVYACGITPHMYDQSTDRLPHERHKIQQLIHKTALGAEETVKQFFYPKTIEAITFLKSNGFTIIALEQSENSEPLLHYALNIAKTHSRIALIVGPELEGIQEDLLRECHTIVEIPMHGKKESFNVAVATGITLFILTSVDHL